MRNKKAEGIKESILHRIEQVEAQCPSGKEKQSYLEALNYVLECFEPSKPLNKGKEIRACEDWGLKKLIEPKTRKLDEPPSMEELECLIMWPKGSKGESQERNAIISHIEQCKINGWGRMTQIAEWIDDIWRHPENVESYKKMQKKHFKDLDWE